MLVFVFLHRTISNIHFPFSLLSFMKYSQNLDDIDLIKYTIITLPPGTSIAFIFKNFVKKRLGESLVPHTEASEVKTYVRHLNNVVVRSIKESLNSFQRNPLGKSSYQPLPQGYNPYDYIIPKPGSEHLRLPPFTYEDWKSQFEPIPIEPVKMPPKKKSKAKQGEVEEDMFSPTKPSTVPNQTATDNANNGPDVPVSPRIPAWLKPRYGSPLGVPVHGVDVDYHLIMSFDENNLAFAGEIFNLYAALVNNGAEKNGVKTDVLLLVHVRSHPLDNGQPISGMVPYLGSDSKTIFMPISCSTEPTIFDSVIPTIMSDETKRLGSELQQLGTYCDAFREKAAQCPVYHIKVAIEFKNFPLFARGGELQMEELIAVNSDQLSTYILSRGYRFTDTVLNKISDYNQTAHVIIAPLKTKKLAVSFQLIFNVETISTSTLTVICIASLLLIGETRRNEECYSSYVGKS